MRKPSRPIGSLMRLIVPCAFVLAWDGRALAADGSSGEITKQDKVFITGQAIKGGSELELKISQFVRSQAARTHIDQYARWRNPVCPRTVGLASAEQADFVSARVKEIARIAAAPVEKVCDPGDVNITVAFTTEPQKLLDYYADKQSWVLGYHYLSKRDGLATMKAPIQAWYATATRGGTGSGRAHRDDAYERDPGGGAASRLTNGLASEFAHVLVVVDATQIDGLKLDAVSDFIGFIALSQQSPLASCGSLPSIRDLLSACDAPEKPRALTAADTAYLNALYGIDEISIGSIQKSQLTTQMRRELLE